MEDSISRPEPSKPLDTGSTEGEMNYSFIYNLTKVPCFRETMLYSIASGGALSMLRFYRTRNVLKSADLAVKSWAVFSIVGWFMCRRQYEDRRKDVRDQLDDINRKTMEKLIEIKEQSGKKDA